MLKKGIQKICLLMAMVLALAGTVHISARADFGDYNDYDSGSDWGSDSDWDSDYDYDYDYDDYSSSSSGGNADNPGAVLLIILIIIVIIMTSGKTKNQKTKTASAPVVRKAAKTLPNRTGEISNVIRSRDELFSAPDFISYAKKVFMDIQSAWEKRDLEPVRGVLHQNLYQQTQRQIDRKIADGVINHLERISISSCYLTTYRRDEQYEYLGVYLAASMIDYQVKEATGELLCGNKTTRWPMYYKMIFMRSNNAKTAKASDEEQDFMCPNCGAPLEGTSFGVCEYCGSTITVGEYGWVLSDFGSIKDTDTDEGIVINDR